MSKAAPQLSPDQERIVYGEGNALVSARPGSGKTRVLSSRAIYLLGHSSGVLGAVSFTRDSSVELRSRIVAGAGEGVGKRLVTGTFHGLAGSQIRKIPEYRALRIVGGGESQIFLRRAMEEVECALEFDDALAQLDAMKSTPDPETVADNQGLQLLKAYNQFLRQNHCMDFSDMIGLAVEGMRSGKIAPHPFSWLLVDEAQDIDSLQFEWVGLHAAAGAEVLVVGDDDQCIYGWRNAMGYDGMLQFVEKHNARHVQLPTNYRSGQSILERAERVIARNLKRVDKPLVFGRDVSGTVRVRSASDREAEAKMALEACRNTPGDWAILARTNKLLNAVETELKIAEVPHSLCGGKSVFEDGVGEVMCSILNSIDKGDCRGLISALLYAGFNRNMFQKLGIEADMPTAQGIQHSLDRAAKFDGDPSHISTLKALDKLWRVWVAANQKGRVKVVVDAVRQWMVGFATPTEASLLNGCFKALTHDRFEESAAPLRDRVWAMTGTSSKQSKEGVQLVTMHSSKGLEFPNVWIIGCENGNNPHSDNPDKAEERRLFYVAMTRAEDNLVMSYSLDSGNGPSEYLVDCGLVRARGVGTSVA